MRPREGYRSASRESPVSALRDIPQRGGRTAVRAAKVRERKAKGKSKRGLLVLRIKRRGIEELAPDLLVGIHEALDPLEDTP